MHKVRTLDETMRAIELAFGLHDAEVVDTSSSYPTRYVLRVRAREGEFAAKVDLDPPSEPDRVGRVLAAAAAVGYPNAPRIRATTAGSSFAALPNATVTLLEWLPNPVTTSPDQWELLGEAVGVLHRLPGGSVAHAVDPDAAIAALMSRTGDEIDVPSYRRLLGKIDHEALSGDATLVHGEVNESNARRRADGTVALIDWDQAGTAAPAFDYGYPLIVRFIDIETLRVDVDIARAWFCGYRSAGRPVDPHAALEAGFFHALRYLWFADAPARWRRIAWAADHTDELLDVVSGELR